MTIADAALDEIIADHATTQARLETEAWDINKHRLGVSFKQGHRSGWRAAILYTLTLQAAVDDLDIDEWLHELRKGNASIYAPVLAADPCRLIHCPGCDAPTVIDRAGTCDRCTYDFTGTRA